jgi:hypothetical protein
MLIPNLIYKAGGACPLHSRNQHGSINCQVVTWAVVTGDLSAKVQREEKKRRREDDNED